MPICAFDVFDGGRAEPVADANSASLGRYRWIHFDLSDPSLQDWSMEHLPELAADSLLQSETRPRCDSYLDGLILNLRGVNLNADGPVDLMVSLCIWVTGHLIVTVRLRKVFALDDIRKSCEAGDAPATVAQFLDRLVEGLTLRARDVVLDMDRKTEALEEAFDAEDEEPDAQALKSARKTVIRLRRYLAPQQQALSRLLSVDSPVFPSGADRMDLRESVNLTALNSEALEALAARLETLQDYTETQTANRLARNGYALSVVAAIFLPLGFFTGLFGVNVGGMPGMAWPWAFAALTGAMIGIGIASFAFLKWLRLL
jgi:zinc transporter